MNQEPSRAPVMLVHGFLASPTIMWPIRRRLIAAGCEVHSPRLSPLVIQDVRQLARQLDRSVEALLDRTGADRIDLVGASQGGLLGLWWAHHLGGWARVRRLVLVGSPVRGTWVALAALPVFGLLGRGAWQLLPDSALLRELTPPLPPSAEVVTVSMHGDPVAPPARCRLPGADNHVVRPGIGPLTHQWMMLSPAVGEVLQQAVSP